MKIFSYVAVVPRDIVQMRKGTFRVFYENSLDAPKKQAYVNNATEAGYT